MKKIKQIIAIGLLSSVLFTNIPITTAEWVHTYRKLIHKPFWLFNAQDKNKNKNEQLCDQGYIFDILDENWNKIEEYIPEWCKKEIFEEESLEEDFPLQEEILETDDFLDDLFLDMWNGNSEPDDFFEEEENLEQYSNEDTNPEASWDDEMDDLLKSLFWKTINKRLNISKINNDLNLWAKNLVSTIKNFSSNKLEFNLWAITVNLLKYQPEYNSKITSLVSRVDKEFRVDSIKNDFAKNISTLSYSLSTYIDIKNTSETKEVFRKKLINDLKTLKKKYKILKRKDMIVAKTLEKRDEL